MRIKVGNRWFDSTEERIMIEVNAGEREQIATMAGTRYAVFPGGEDLRDIRFWMDAGARPSPALKPRVVASSVAAEGGALVECPTCRTQALADHDQVAGRVSMICDCGYHETHDLRADLEALGPILATDRPLFEGPHGG